MSNLLSQASLVMIPSGYKEDVVYSQIPTDGSGDLTFTRASNGTRINSAGLVEVCPWNLASDSNSFGGLSAITKTTGQPSPIDSTSGNLLTATGSGEHYSGTASLTVIAKNTYTYSVYGKFVQGVNLALRTVFANGDADISTIWNLNTGALVLNAGDHQNPTITNVGNGWYRCSITYTPASVPAFPLLFRLQMAVGSNLSFTATSGDGFLAYGAQINNGAIAPYFPTTDRLNVPRLTYQNGGGGCPSLLLEKQSTNLVTYSEQFDNAIWSKLDSGSGSTTPVVTANYATSPDGTQNADRLQCTLGSSGYSLIQQSPIASGTHTGSIWVKSNTGANQNIYFRVSQNTTPYVVTPEWQRITLTEVNGDYLTIGLRDSTGYANYSCDILIWGAQLEASSYATSYIPTTSSSATRVADSCFKDGLSVFGTNQGTFFVDSIGPKFQTAAQYLFDLSDNAGANRFALYSVSNTELSLYTNTGNNFSADVFGRNKIAVSWNGTTCKLYMNGTQMLNISCPTSNPTSINLNSRYNDVEYGDSQFNEVVCFPTALTNAELASLTTI